MSPRRPITLEEMTAEQLAQRFFTIALQQHEAMLY
jgi:hypothetical protein